MAIYVSLTALPSREKVLSSTLDALLSQTRRPDHIFVHLCPYYRRLQRPLPETFLTEFKQHPDVSLVTVPDEGPATKYLSANAISQSPDDTLIICDDDVLYPQDSVERAIRFLESHPKSAVGYLGRVLGPSLRFNRGIRVFDQPQARDLSLRVDVLMATGMIALRADSLPPDLLPRWKKALAHGPHESIYLTDDIFLNATLSENGIRRYVLPGWVFCQRRPVPDALWAANHDGQNNDASLEYFKRSFLPVSHGPLKRFWIRNTLGAHT